MKFKIGDKVKVIGESVIDDRHLIGMVGKVVNIEYEVEIYHVGFGRTIEQKHNDVNSTTHKFIEDELMLVQKGKSKPEKPEDLTRYMVYGVSCNNRSGMISTEKELKDELRRRADDSEWTGRIIGYKLIPILEAEKKVLLKSFKRTVIKRVVRKRK